MKKIIIVIAFALLLVGCGKEPVEEVVEETKTTATALQVRTMELIINEVELAYATATLNNQGNYPTIKQVSETFKMANATMNEKGDITVKVEGVSCGTGIVSNVLTISCVAGDEVKSTKNLTLSN